MQQLGLSQAQKTASRGDTEFDQGQAIKRAQVLNQFARAFKGLDPSQRQAAFQKSVPRLQEFGIDTQQFEGSQFTDPELDQAIAETQGFINDPTSLSSAQRERAGLIEAIQPALDENGKFDPNLADANAMSAAQALNLVAKPGTITGQQRTATTPGLSEQIAVSEQTISGGKERGKLEVQAELLPSIRADIKQAEKEALARGETKTDLIASKAAMPGLITVVDRLKILSDDATFTLGGKGFNEVAKQFGFSTKGGTARDTMVSIVDNQVLPLLKPIFGAAFTAIEGDRLRNAFLDPDATAESRKAQVQSFLEQMQRNIETKERELELSGQANEQGSAGTFTSSTGIEFTVE